MLIRPAIYLKAFIFNFLDKKDRDAIKIDIYLQPIEKGAKEILNNLFFATNEYKLDNKSKTEIDKIVRFMSEYQKVSLEISGHTDDVDTDEFNQKLSEKRAKSVYDYLIKSGIPSLRLTFKGYGEKQPTVPNDSETNKAINRRIEFKVIQKIIKYIFKNAVEFIMAFLNYCHPHIHILLFFFQSLAFQFDIIYFCNPNFNFLKPKVENAIKKLRNGIHFNSRFI